MSSINTSWTTDSNTKASETTSASLNNATLSGTLAVTGIISPSTHIDMPDSANIKLGTGDDLQLYHDGSHSYITNAVGTLKLATETSGIAITIGHTTSEVTIADNLTVTGTLTLGSGAELTEAELEMLDGITAGTAAASKALVLDSNKDIGTIRNLTIDGTFSDGNYTFDTSGNVTGLGNVTMTGDLTVSGGDAILTAANDAASSILMQADNSDDAGDDWKIIANADQTFTIGNDIASAGTYVPFITITPSSSVNSSQLAFAGSIVAGGSVFASAGGYLATSSEIRHASIIAITLDGSTKATFVGYIVEGRTVIKIPATAFKANDDGLGVTHIVGSIEDDGSNFGLRPGSTSLEFYAYIDVPLGYTATKVKITGSDTANEVEVYTLDLDDGTIGSEISNSGLTVADDTALASNHVGADDKMLLIKVVTTAVDDIIYGGYVTIEAT